MRYYYKIRDLDNGLIEISVLDYYILLNKNIKKDIIFNNEEKRIIIVLLF